MGNTTDKKKVIHTVDEFNMLKKIMKKDAFYAKFELSIGLVTKITAKESVLENIYTDMSMNSAQKKMLINGEF